MPPAARVTDMHVCPMVTGLSRMWGAHPAAVRDDSPHWLASGGAYHRYGHLRRSAGYDRDGIFVGFDRIFAGARMGDNTVHGGMIVIGCFTVIIGG